MRDKITLFSLGKVENIYLKAELTSSKLHS